jgi:hypothetical protein
VTADEITKKIHSKVGVPVVKHHALKRGGTEVKFHSFLTPALEAIEWSN